MLKKTFSLIIVLITTSCFNKKIEEIKYFNFDELNTTQSSQVNSKYLEGINFLDLEVHLLKNNFQKETVKELSDSLISKKYIFSEPESTYEIIVSGDQKIKKIEFYSKSNINPLKMANIFFKNASKIPIPQVDTLRVRKWTEKNITSINKDLSKATILSNVYYNLKQISQNEFKLTIKKY